VRDVDALVDIGVNLAHRRLYDDRVEVVARAREVGVVQIVATGTSVPMSRAVADLAAEHDGVFATAGVHPHHAKDVDETTIATLRELAVSRPGVVAIGECGLDYDRDFSPRDVQREVFAAQLQLAVDVGLPVFLHERAAHEDFHRIVAEHRDALVGGVVHCFTGPGPELDAYLQLDMHIGITGWICDERRGLHLREIVARIPSSRLLLETDAPFLLPRTITPKPKGKTRRNEPAMLPWVLRTVAQAVGRPAASVAAESTAAARELFKLPA
jgi:TatD DNase family protein